MTEQEKQELVKTILDRLKDYRLATYYDKVERIEKVIKEIEIEYGLIPKYPTLRDYINEHSNGAYHNFNFIYNHNKVNVKDCSEFEHYYNAKFLDENVVTLDVKSDNGADCDQYQCTHILTLEKVK